MSLVNKFFKTSVVYLLGKATTYIVSFLMLRYYTKNVSPSEYGQYENIYALINVAIPILFIEIWSGILRFAITDDVIRKKKVISTVFIMLIPSSFMYSIVYFGVSYAFGWNYILEVYLFSLTYMLLNIMMMMARALSKNVLYAASGILGAIFNAITGIICVSVLKMQCVAMMYAMIVNYIVQIAILLYGTKAWRYIEKKCIDKETAKEIVRFCAPFCINTFLYYINTNYYKSVVNNELGSDVLGIFTVSTKFCVIVTFVVSVFHLSWQEMAFGLSDRDNRKGIFSNGLNLISDVVMIGTIALLPFVKVIFPIFIGAEYSQAHQFIPAYYSTIFFTSISGFLYNTLAAEKITIYHPVAKFISAVANMSLLYSLINVIGVYAAVWGAVVSSIIEMIVLIYISKKKLKIDMRYRTTIAFCLLYLVGCAVYYFTGRLINLLFFVLVLGLGLLYFIHVHRSICNSMMRSLKSKLHR